jgi:hypothetical protein
MSFYAKFVVLFFLKIDARKHHGFFEFMPLVSDIADENDDRATEVLVSQGSPLEGIA